MGKRAVIVGAGLCGTLLAIRLAERGYQVTIYERRADLRKSKVSAGRSINLALSNRGIRSLEMAGLKNDISPLIIPMHGRMIHPLLGENQFVRYSGRQGEWINSISRMGLNKVLLEKAETYGKIEMVFDTDCIGVDFDSATLKLKNNITGHAYDVTGDIFFGADGANSAIRSALLQQSAKYRFDFSQQYLTTAYKELEIPTTSDGGYRLEKNALHIWPRDGFMMIALPNLEGNFTVTLFMPLNGKSSSFSCLQTENEILEFFSMNFPTALKHMPDILKDFYQNPTSSLSTVKCYPWQVENKFLLLGDAAHAVVPFYGQGMNASFEDVVILDEMIEEYKEDWHEILPAFQQKRKIDSDAIADLAVENEVEMRDATADPVFLLKRQIELKLEQKYPDYYSKYSMVTFRDDLPYHEAKEKGRAQDKLLMAYAEDIKHIDAMDENVIMGMLKKLKH